MKNEPALLWISLSTLSLSVLAGPPDLSKLPPPAAQKGVTYAKDIRPIFENSCFRCHGMERPKAGLRLDSLDGVLKGSKDGKVIIPGQSDKSLLVIAVARLDEEKAMPPEPRQWGHGPGGAGGAAGPGAPGTPPNAQTPPHNDGGAQGAGGPPRGGMWAPPKPLSAEQVGLIRAWVDQGAK